MSRATKRTRRVVMARERERVRQSSGCDLDGPWLPAAADAERPGRFVRFADGGQP